MHQTGIEGAGSKTVVCWGLGFRISAPAIYRLEESLVSTFVGSWDQTGNQDVIKKDSAGQRAVLKVMRLSHLS